VHALRELSDADVVLVSQELKEPHLVKIVIPFLHRELTQIINFEIFYIVGKCAYVLKGHARCRETFYRESLKLSDPN
jgi:hypothetical protein